ncbi:MAG: hypothetical protein KA138_02820 [Saprospiraceae bacterium]|jgi:uncharacterized protein YciI|nr:hypothetical protein [Saprospiraceae bacterium]
MFNTKMRVPTFLLLLATMASFFTVGCDKKDDPTPQELITKVAVHLTGTNGSSFNQEFEAEDLEGDGIWNNIPSINIPANTTFHVHVHVYDGETEINDEIEAENTEHLFVYKISGANLVVSGLNLDDDGNPFGIDSEWTSAAASTGTVQIKLIHEPTDKNALDPGGEVDFDVTFPVIIQ